MTSFRPIFEILSLTRSPRNLQTSVGSRLQRVTGHKVSDLERVGSGSGQLLIKGVSLHKHKDPLRLTIKVPEHGVETLKPSALSCHK